MGTLGTRHPSVAVVCPSYGRAGSVITRRWWPDLTLAVRESQAEEYAEREGGDLLLLPDAECQNLPDTRNWLLDTLFATYEWVLMVDDDVSEVARFSVRERKGKLGSHTIPYDAETIWHLIENGCTLAEDLGAHLWGLNVQADPKFYREYTPVSFLSPILDPFKAHRRSSPRYDATVACKMDYDFWLQHIAIDHRTLRLNYAFYRADHFAAQGGMTTQRNMTVEREHGERLVRKWGPQVVRFNWDKSVNPKVTVPLAGM
jgi:hypothetical protein